MKDFNIAKYLKENHLGSHGILGRYVDLHGLKEEEDYGNNKPVDEVPYVGADEKLDGFGDEFDQVEPVSEIEDAEENTWMYDVDGTEAYKEGNWKCEWQHPGILVWSYKNIPSDKLSITATPNFDGDGNTSVIMSIDGDTGNITDLNQGVFANFDEYAAAMKPVLDVISNLESDPEVSEEVTVSSSGVEMEEAMDGEDYSEEQGQFDTMMDLSHEYLGDPRISNIVRVSIKNLRDHGFSDQDIVDFLATEF